MKFLTLLLFFSIWVVTPKSDALTCSSVLEEDIFKSLLDAVEDPYRVYALGKSLEGKDRIHVIDSDFIKSDAALDTSKILEKREDLYEIPGRTSLTADEFSLYIPEKRASWDYALTSPRVKRLLSRFVERLDESALGAQAYKLKNFRYENTGRMRLLFLLEIEYRGRPLEVVFSVRASPATALVHAHVYGEYILYKLGISSFRGKVLRFYGESN